MDQQNPSSTDEIAPVNARHLTWRDRTARVLNGFGVLMALVLILSISLETFSGRVFTQDSIYERIQLWVCVYFLVDIFLFMLVMPERRRFFFRNLLLILLSIPYLSLVNYLSLAPPDAVRYLLKFLPIMRGGVALIVLVKMVVTNKLTGMFISYLVSFFSTVYFLTLVFFVFEKGPNPQVDDYYAALWWASMTVTTVGSNIIPVTPIGKVVTAIMAMLGMTVFPIFTVYISSLVLHWTGQQRRS